MKFSNKLFKIQAKISVSAFILIGSVCHLGASDDLSAGEFDERLLTGVSSFGTPVQGRSEFKAAGYSSKGNHRDSLDSVSSQSPVHVRQLKKNIGNQQQGKVEEFARPRNINRQEKPSVVANPSGGLERSLSVLNNPQLITNALAKKVRGDEGRGRDGGRGRGSGSERAWSKQKTPEVLFDAVYSGNKQNRNSPGFFGRVGYSSNPNQGTLSVGETLLFTSPIKSPVKEISPRKESVGKALLERLSHESEGAVVLHGRGDALAVLTAKSSDEITLHVAGKDRKTTIEQMVASVDVTDANKQLSFQKHYFHCLKLSEVDRTAYLELLLAKPEFKGQTLKTAWKFLQESADSAYTSLRGFFMAGNLRDKMHAEFIRNILAESQTVISQNQTLVTTLRQAYATSSSSAISKEFAANPTGVLSLDTSEWTTSQFSKCIEFIVNQFVGSQETTNIQAKSMNKLITTFSKRSDELAAENAELNVELIESKSKLRITAKTINDLKEENSELKTSLKESKIKLRASVATAELLTEGQSKLEAELRELRALRETWQIERSTLADRVAELLEENRELKAVKKTPA
ncbi:MAG: hypothetical protein V4544_01390 [Pseudomonadota bacterium]